MKRMIFGILLSLAANAAAVEPLQAPLEAAYDNWRNAIVAKDLNAWQRATARFRQMEVRNRILSEKLPFPAALFDLPAPPPKLGGLKFLAAQQVGPTAKAAYFGRIDFAIGGDPTDNLLVLAFVNEGGRWTYDRANYVSLAALPEVRNELAAGDLDYLKTNPEAQPDGKVPPVPPAVGPAPFIAKVYVFSPGREVTVLVNGVSRHKFLNAKEAEIVIGGAREGSNEVQFAIAKMDGGTGKEALTIRVYLLSQVEGVQPIKIYEYLVNENELPKNFGTGNFVVDAGVAHKLAGK